MSMSNGERAEFSFFLVHKFFQHSYHLFVIQIV